MDANYKPFHPNPSKPNFQLPAGAVDAHCHIFGPEAVFPFAPERRFTPCDAPKEKLFALRDFLGFARNVIVQATCHGNDNRAMLDAIEASNGLARGVATVGEDVGGDDLMAFDRAGVRGVRYNFAPRLTDSALLDAMMRVAKKIEPLGWHVVVYFDAADIAELAPVLAKLPTKVVLDHMGRPDVKLGVDHPRFQAFEALLADHENIWSKVTCPDRVSLQGPPYDDVAPFGKRLVERFPDRVIWGTDWPHPNTQVPDDGALVDYIPRIAATPALRQKLLVDNPMALYWS